MIDRRLRQAGWLAVASAAVVTLGALAAAQQSRTITPTAKALNRSFDADAEQWAERFEHEGRAIYDKRFEIVAAMDLRRGMAAADIGAGSGLIARLMAEEVGPEGTVYAVDIAKNMVDYIERTARAQRLTNLKAVRGDARSPRLPANSVDRVCLIDTYHHFEYPSEMLAQIKKALRPDGMLLLNDFKRVPRVSRPYVLNMVRAGGKTFVDEFRKAGFEVIERNEDMFPENYLLKFRHREAGTDVMKDLTESNVGRALHPRPSGPFRELLQERERPHPSSAVISKPGVTRRTNRRGKISYSSRKGPLGRS